MDRADDPVGFDEAGVCSYCRSYDAALLAQPTRDPDALSKVIREIKALGRGKEYDCILGLSGGVDSSYVAYLAVQHGLRPLAVHLDNGWNSELAVNNIHQIVSKLGIELHTHVVDWPEFRALQLAYLRSGVVDIEVVSDHAINAIAYRTALDEKVKVILRGNNVATEFVMPSAWHYRKQDLRNLKAISRRFDGPKLKTFPTGSTIQFEWWRVGRGISSVDLLDYIGYDKATAVETLVDLGWRPYPGKHYESLFTQFYQAHILPTKFGIDKRKAHLASLVVSGQLSRDDALERLARPIYEPEELRQHTDYVLKKLGMSTEEFRVLMSDTPRAHTDFPHDGWYAFYAMKVMRLALRPVVALRAWRRRRAADVPDPAGYASDERSVSTR